jgi:hypothetical protein
MRSKISRIAEFTTRLRRSRQRRHVERLNALVSSLRTHGRRELVREGKRITRNAVRRQLRRLINT